MQRAPTTPRSIDSHVEVSSPGAAPSNLGSITFVNRQNFSADHIAQVGTPAEIGGCLVETHIFGPHESKIHGPWPSASAITRFKPLWEAAHPGVKWNTAVRAPAPLCAKRPPPSHLEQRCRLSTVPFEMPLSSNSASSTRTARRTMRRPRRGRRHRRPFQGLHRSTMTWTPPART